MTTIVGISGSLRAGSFNGALLRTALEKLKGAHWREFLSRWSN